MDKTTINQDDILLDNLSDQEDDIGCHPKSIPKGHPRKHRVKGGNEVSRSYQLWVLRASGLTSRVAGRRVSNVTNFKVSLWEHGKMIKPLASPWGPIIDQALTGSILEEARVECPSSLN
ncbi:hypothetical protein Tco_0928090, partial [Tanacetum coccineum]